MLYAGTIVNVGCRVEGRPKALGTIGPSSRQRYEVEEDWTTEKDKGASDAGSNVSLQPVVMGVRKSVSSTPPKRRQGQRKLG